MPTRSGFRREEVYSCLPLGFLLKRRIIMPYAAVTYSKSIRPYTFFTSNPGLTAGQTVLVKDKNGFSLCAFVGYVPKPSFSCNVILMSQLDLEELAEEVRIEMEFPEKEKEDIEETGEDDWPEDEEEDEDELA
jgi:hypothetical protein